MSRQLKIPREYRGFELATAAFNGHADVVDFILAKLSEEVLSGNRGKDDFEAALNEKDELDRTPLILAAAGGFKNVVELLLELTDDYDLKVNIRSKNGMTALRAALVSGHSEVAELLLMNNKFNLMENGEEMTYGGGWTPLTSAASQGFLVVVKLLIKHGAKADTADGDRATPLFLACSGGHLRVVMLLLRRNNPPLEEPNKVGLTPLIVAATEGHASVVALLLDKGAKVDAMGNEGETALKGAITNGHAAVVKLLYDHERKNPKGGTPAATAPPIRPTPLASGASGINVGK